MHLHELRVMLYAFVFVMVGGTVAQAASTNGTAADVTTAPRNVPTTTPTSKKQSSTPAPRPTTQASSTSIRPTLSTQSPEELCSQFSGKSCSECLGAAAKCLWCNTNDTCMAYPLSKVLPPSDMCALDKARWGVCWLNFEALIIGVSTVGGIILLTITCCCVYCCCCRKGRRKYEMEDARFNAQKMERKAKADERRSERKERLDEIRRKYGLVKDEPYHKFES